MPDYTITVRLRGEDGISSTVKSVSGNINQLGNSADSASQKSGGLGAAMGKLKQELLGIGTAFGLVKFGQMIGDLNEIGMKANAAENTFTALSGGATQAATNLDLMRSATRGVVDDMTLMNGANRLLLMGLAGSGDEAAKLASGAVALGKAMGMDAAQSVESFAALLANRSIPRLDNFGISAANVRVRIDELKTAGYGLEEAFNMAVIAEMNVSMERLGDSLDANATAWERWGVRIQNIQQNAGQDIAAGFEGWAFALEAVMGLTPQQEAFKATQALDFQDIFRDMLALAPDATGEQQQAIAQFILAMQQEALNDPTIAHNAEALYRRAIGSEAGGAAFAIAATAPGDMGILKMVYEQRTAYNEMMRNEAEANAEIQAALDERAAMYASFAQEDFFQHEIVPRRQLKEASDVMEEFNQTNAYVRQRTALVLSHAATDFYNFFTDIPDRAAAFNARMGELLAPRNDALGQYGKVIVGLAGNAGSTLSQFGIDPETLFSMSRDIELPEFMRPETAQSIAQQYAVVEQQWQRMSELNQQGLITDAELARLTTFKDNMANINSQAQAAATALNSLADITGQTGGGILGELGSVVMGQAGSSGMSDELMAQLQREINLASGAETASSVALEEQAAPLILAIAEQLGPAAAAQALQALQTNLEEATYQGLSQEQIAAMIPQYTGYTMGVGGVVSQIPQMMASAMGGALLDPGATGGKPGVPGGAMSASAEMAVMEEKLPVIGELMLPVKESAGAYAASMTEAKTSLTQSISGAEELRHTLDGMGEERTLRVRIEAIDPSGVLALAGTPGASLGQTVRDNGGRVPGVDSRIPQ